jgi:putative FmdB family regulatory protein
MPIYDFQCSSCGHKAEVMRKISAASVDTCPECGAETFSKQLSAPSFQLSGSGWYATDFKNGGSKTPSKDGAGKDAASTTESSAEKKSDAAPSPAACATGCACH